MKTWRTPEGDEKFEMTPMIDIVFLLITFFMTVTSYANAELIPVMMPNAPSAKVPEEVGERQFLSIQRKNDGTTLYYLGAFEASLEDITNALKARNSKEGFKGAYIRADARTHHRYVNDLMKACAEAGVYNILFGTLKD